jgi:hypothetical protein
VQTSHTCQTSVSSIAVDLFTTANNSNRSSYALCTVSSLNFASLPFMFLYPTYNFFSKALNIVTFLKRNAQLLFNFIKQQNRSCSHQSCTLLLAVMKKIPSNTNILSLKDYAPLQMKKNEGFLQVSKKTNQYECLCAQ